VEQGAPLAFQRKKKGRIKRKERIRASKRVKQKEIVKRLREREKTCGERKKESYTRGLHAEDEDREPR